MKKIVFLAIIVLFAGCELERLPYEGFSLEQIMRDPQNSLNMLLNGTYGQMKAWSNEKNRIGEYGGDNMMIRGTSTDAFFDYISYVRRPANGRSNVFWVNSYRVISQASQIINMFDANDENFRHQIGEAYYLRGLMYFYLVKTFGRPFYQNPDAPLGGVPILFGMPDDVLADNITLPDRSTVRETYAQAIADLERSYELMTMDRPARPVIFASKEAAWAILSRIYLYMSGTYEDPNLVYAQKSIDYANRVIASNRFRLEPRNRFMIYNEFTPQQTTETIFAIMRVGAEFTSGDHTNSPGGMYASIGGTGWGEMYASATLIDRLRASGGGDLTADARWNFIRPQYQLTAATPTTPAARIPAFRFIKPVHITATTANLNAGTAGRQSHWNYVQEPFREVGGDAHIIRTFPYERKNWTTANPTNPDRDQNTITQILYPLTLVCDQFETFNRYMIYYHNDPGARVREANGVWHLEVTMGTNVIRHPLTEITIPANDPDRPAPPAPTTPPTPAIDIPVVRRFTIDIAPEHRLPIVGDRDHMMQLNQGHPMFFVFRISFQSQDRHLHSPVISRLAEMYLNLAEAHAKLGDFDAALTNLNIIRNRAVIDGGHPAGFFNGKSIAEIAEIIDNERAMELAFEGHRSFDRFRIGLPMIRQHPHSVDVMNDIYPDDIRIIRLIPQQAIDAYMGTLTQNPM